jgi:GT2 family glycosyltransferase
MHVDGRATVVSPTFQRVDRLGETLAPLLGDAATTKVIVVDDGSGRGRAG